MDLVERLVFLFCYRCLSNSYSGMDVHGQELKNSVRFFEDNCRCIVLYFIMQRYFTSSNKCGIRNFVELPYVQLVLKFVCVFKEKKIVKFDVVG